MVSKLKLTLGLLVVAAVSLSAATVVKTRHEYYGVCSKLDGFAGFLQKAGFLAPGNCTTQIGGTLCNKGAPCSAGATFGNCANIGGIGGSIVCSCVSGSSQ